MDNLKVQPLPKFRELRRGGFSRRSLELLGDKFLLGTWSPTRVYARLMTRSEARLFMRTGGILSSAESGGLVPVLDAISKSNLQNLNRLNRNQLSEFHKSIGGDGNRNVVVFFRSSEIPPTAIDIPFRRGVKGFTEAKFEGGIKVDIIDPNDL